MCWAPAMETTVSPESSPGATRRAWRTQTTARTPSPDRARRARRAANPAAALLRVPSCAHIPQTSGPARVTVYGLWRFETLKICTVTAAYASSSCSQRHLAARFRPRAAETPGPGCTEKKSLPPPGPSLTTKTKTGPASEPLVSSPYAVSTHTPTRTHARTRTCTHVRCTSTHALPITHTTPENPGLRRRLAVAHRNRFRPTKGFAFINIIPPGNTSFTPAGAQHVAT